METIGTDNPYYLYVYGTFLAEYLSYWLTASLYMILDFTQRPKFLHKYKTQPGTNEPPNMKKFVKVSFAKFINETGYSITQYYKMLVMLSPLRYVNHSVISKVKENTAPFRECHFLFLVNLPKSKAAKKNIAMEVAG